MIVKIASNILSLMSFCLIYQVFFNSRTLTYGGGKPVFFTLWVIGFAMSILGGARDFKNGFDAMPKPLMNLLMVLGIASLALLVVMLCTMKRQNIMSFALATKVLGVLIAAKFVITRGFNVLK